MKDKVYFIQLPMSDSGARLPQAVGTIWSYCEQFAEVLDRYELGGVWWNTPIEIVNPSVVAASCYMWNWTATYKILKQVRKDYPNCKIIVGGPDPQYSTDWCERHPEVDAVVAYYGEETFKQLLLNDTLDLPGVVTKDFNNSKSAIYANPNTIPSPYLNGFFDKLLENNNKKSIRTIFEGNRGCPYSCSFCDIGSLMYQKIQMFDTDRCLAELDWMVKRNVSVIDVADSNFGIFPRDEMLVDFLIEKKISNEFNGLFAPTWAKNHGERIIRLAKKLQEHNIENIFGFSLQSTNPETLKTVKRTNTFNIQEFVPIIKDMKKNNVSTYTELIFPLPGDTVETFTNGMYEILDMDVPFEMLQINSLSRLSNTEFNTGFDKLSWANIIGTAKHYDNDVVDEVCISTETLDEDAVFEMLFFSRAFLIPMYWYGLTTYLADHLYSNNIKSRSELHKDLYSQLQKEEMFIKLKQDMKAHYFDSIKNNGHFGYYIYDMWYTDTAHAHLYYYQNNIFDILLKLYPEYNDIIVSNNNDFLEITDLNQWLLKIHIRGRFSKGWNKNE